MKKTTKFLAMTVAVLAILFTTGKVKAQDSKGNWRFGVGVEGGIPLSNAKDISKFELGGTARLQYDVKGSVSLMLTSGYYNFFGKEVPGQTDVKYKSLGVVPLKAGIKAFFAPNVYVSGEVGAGFETNYNKDTKLILSPGIGYATNSGLDIGARYENFSGQSNNYGLVALRIAYGFRL